jgi:leucyl aminopeptidase
MQFNATKCDLRSKKTECLVLVLSNKYDKHSNPQSNMNNSAQYLGPTIIEFITKLQGSGDIQKKLGSSVTINYPDGLEAQRLLIVSSGTEILNEQMFLSLAKTIGFKLRDLPVKDAVIALRDINVGGRNDVWQAQKISQVLGEQSYFSDSLKTIAKTNYSLKKVLLALPSNQKLKEIKDACKLGFSVSKGMNLSKYLGDLPGNICTPSFLAKEAKKLAMGHSQLSCEIINEAEMKSLGMHSLLSVTAGTKQPAKMIVLKYNGSTKEREKPIVLVGKGVTFDSGGISLKPGAAMDEMKYDMCGAATVLGVFSMLVDTDLNINVVGVMPAVENMPGGNAIKPGDIVKSMSGQTIEILNTDAEGRLILCDALTYVARFKPKNVIDIATLTGACVMTLGSHASGLLSNDDILAKKLEIAGQTSSDRIWRLPIWSEYDAQLKSNFADMANLGGRLAGTITAACFLARFTKEYKWAHLDIAGTAWKSGSSKGSTGRPVPLLCQFLIEEANDD